MFTLTTGQALMQNKSNFTTNKFATYELIIFLSLCRNSLNVNYSKNNHSKITNTLENSIIVENLKTKDRNKLW